ncbi:hypothetical protein BC833DRAFT_604044 [Globomyces pollinis-pini]|nr:hypothetical protein BC833DRAFT_604044 [Globomyces pollinis-pini]
MVYQCLYFSLLFATTLAQITCDANSKSKTTFNACIANGIVDTSGQPITNPANRLPANACNAYQNENQALYLACLCANTNTVVGCYTSYCPLDVKLQSYQSTQASICAASEANPLPKSKNTPSAVVPSSSNQDVKTPATSPVAAKFQPNENGQRRDFEFNMIFFIMSITCLLFS